MSKTFINSLPENHVVKESVENFDFNFNKTSILGMMIDDGFGELNWEELKTHLNKIANEGIDVAV